MSAVYPVLSLFVGGLFVAACTNDNSVSSTSVEDAGETANDAGSETKDSGGSKESDSAAPGECEGKADGTACGSSTSTECDGADKCKSGVCEKNLAKEGTSCGEAPSACTDQGTCDGKGKCNGNPKVAGTECGVASECADAETCDGNGECKSNFKAEGTACGSATSTECSGADTCDGKGACKNNDKDDGTACGNTSDVMCDRADTCLGGACMTNVAPDGAFCQDCAAGVGKCGGCGAGACPNLCASPTTTGIESTFNAGNNRSGNMFEVDATKDVMVLGADVNNMGGADTIQIYTHAGAIAGTTTDSSRWTLRQSTSVDVFSGRTALTTDIFVPLTTGTNSVYITHVNPSLNLNYSNGSGVGTVVADDGVLTIKEGYGKAYPFGAENPNRIWNGAFRYVPGVTTSYAGGVTDHGEMFDVKATVTTSIRALSVNLPAGEHTLRVYFHPGTFVGTEANAAAWTALGGEITVKSGGPNGPTAIPLKIDVTIPAGTSYAFYVTTTGTTSLNATEGNAVGALASPAGAVEIYEGAGVAYPFGTVTKGRKPNVTVYHGNCE
ncbi:Tryptophan synthase alpha chain [Labilithrix luteola]|uniref:Tryptophan synthase alpha chain n=1 Tax=Labilithrix luteola TaxID=1391654 RepID=A0A0K1PR26_9BACT|nr:hypothetical protein [Labilithrix luteola]AKU95569.1 Tryptophan synthase alpha chain [Labilithrix luteola]